MPESAYPIIDINIDNTSPQLFFFSETDYQNKITALIYDIPTNMPSNLLPEIAGRIVYERDYVGEQSFDHRIIHVFNFAPDMDIDISPGVGPEELVAKETYIHILPEMQAKNTNFDPNNLTRIIRIAKPPYTPLGGVIMHEFFKIVRSMSQLDIVIGDEIIVPKPIKR